MSIRSILLPALAIAGGVAAQCSTSATLTIQNAGDASRLSGCRTYTGSIALATGTTDAISIPGVQEITGSLIANNVTGLPSLEAPALQAIDGDFQLYYLTVLTNLNFPRLTKAANIDWRTIPRLNALNFNTGVNDANKVSIVDTALGSLQGLSLDQVDTMIISSNGQLTSFNMPLERIVTALTVEFNSQNMNISLPDLEVVGNATFRNVSGVSFPALTFVNTSMGFYNNFFTSLTAPNLTALGGTLSIVSNGLLTNASFPSLARLGGALQVANNTALDKVTGFSKVNTVNGAVDITGNFSDFTLPALGNSGAGIQGAFNLQSLQNIDAVCSRFAPLEGRNLPIKGKATCLSTNTPTSTDGTTTANGTTSGSGASASKKGAASRDFTPRFVELMAALTFVAAMISIF